MLVFLQRRGVVIIAFSFGFAVTFDQFRRAIEFAPLISISPAVATIVKLNTSLSTAFIERIRLVDNIVVTKFFAGFTDTFIVATGLTFDRI